ncbi:MAG: RCC1 domain-containing protein, partial [Dehalococcoidia bacterium]|nr:RCC1 domain-containing protein [Dehalococcoidia bacterium]
FSQVSAGGYHNCGVRTDGTLACWGAHGDGRTTPPAGTFSQVSAGGYHNCGVRTDGTLACWGAHGYGRTTPPSGTIVIVKATHPAGGTGFGFSDNIAAPNSFNLDDGGTKTFSDIFTDSYTVIEDYPQVAPGGFVLTGLSCTDPDDGSSVDLAARKATVDLDLGETVTCTFTNTATAVGGMVEIQVDGSHSVVDPAAQPSGGSSRQHYIALAALAVAVLAALTASAWYARRRFSRG